MGIFRQFPYTNFHEINLDWIIKKIKELSQEWLSYNTTWDNWKDQINTDFQDLQEYITNYFANLNIKDEIVKQFNILLEDGYFEDIISQLILKKENINCMLKGSGFRNYQEIPAAINGSCYIGNNMIAAYFSSSTTDNGSFVILNATTFDVITETRLDLQHGNSLTYDPEQNFVYACGCYSIADTATLIPKISIIDVSDINNINIVEVVNPPLPTYSTGIYSLAYDPITKQFGAICARGTTSGEYNRLIIYNKELTEILSEVILSGTEPVSSQGVQAIYNNVAYLVYYTPNYRSVYSFDITTGKRLNIYSIPQLINGYRFVGELQSVIYNYDTENWYVVSRYSGSGVRYHTGYSIFEAGFYKAIPNFIITNNNLAQSNIRTTITVQQGSNFVPNSIAKMPCIMDAINASKTAGASASITLTGTNRVIGECEIEGFSGSITGASGNRVTVEGGIKVFNSRVRFSYCDFTGTTTHTYINNVTGNITIYDSNIAITACTFTTLALMSDTIFIGMNTSDTKVNAVRSLIVGNTAALPTGNTILASIYLQQQTT